MAGLAHGVPVVGLHGASTDRVFVERADAVRLTPFGDTSQFARAVVDLCADDPARRALGLAGRRLYCQAFDWPVIARRISAALGG
jgi:glycosyltransferase involved in cell wall biosynthesis